MTSRRGRLITFEGGEGAGKSTQVRRLVSRLLEHGVSVLATREPGGSPFAERLRDVLLSGSMSGLGSAGEALLFTAARIDHVDTAIAPALAAGRFVVCDRYVDSTRAYQGALGAIDPGLIGAFERVSVGPNRPDLTVLIDVPAEIGLARAAARRAQAEADRFESRDMAYHGRLRRAFLDIAEAEPARFLVVDGARASEEIADEVWRDVNIRFLEPIRRAS